MTLPTILGTGNRFIPASVYIGATGNSQSTASYISAYYCYVTTGVAGGGIILPHSEYVGETYLIQNDTSNELLVYPNVGDQIDNGPINAPISIIPYGSGTLAAQTTSIWNTSVDPVVGANGVSVTHQFGGLVVALDPSYNVSVIAQGFNVTISIDVQIQVLNAAAAIITAGTITMPTTPWDGMRLAIVSTEKITGLTLHPGAGQTINNAPTALQQSTKVEFIYQTSTSTWWRLL